jgi:hypothetical protein
MVMYIIDFDVAVFKADAKLDSVCIKNAIKSKTCQRLQTSFSKHLVVSVIKFITHTVQPHPFITFKTFFWLANI